MKILIIHNAYLERGGEDEIVQAHKDMLERNGHKVDLYLRNNAEIESLGFFKKIDFLLNGSRWNRDIYQEICERIRSFRPDVVHIHNTFYLISPSVYAACVDEKVPIIQTLHNYRLLLDRKGPDQFLEFKVRLSEFKKFILRYSIVPRILSSFRANQVLSKIDGFIVLSRFSKQKFAQNDFPEKKLHVLAPSFSIEQKSRETVGRYVIFVGRLVDYKGIHLLLREFSKNPDLNLRIVGDGPLKNEVQKVAGIIKNIDYLGRLPAEQTLEEIRQAACLVAPSYCYETFGRTIAEAFGCGTPVIASNHGAMAELVEEGKTGLLFPVGDGHGLMQKIRQLVAEPALAWEMGQRARSVFEKNFTEKENYHRLLAIYEYLIRGKKNAQISEGI